MNQEKNERNRISTEKSQKITTLVSIIAIVSIKSYIKMVLVFFLHQNFMATIRKKLIHRSSINRLYKRISMQIAGLVSLQVVRVNDKRSKKPRTKENRSNQWNIKDTRCERNILSNG